MSLVSELKRRNVFKTSAVYGVVSWLLIQIVATIEEPLGLPAWFDTSIIVLLAVGFPIVVVLSWAFELTPEGIKPSADVPRTESITRRTGQKLNVVIICALLLAVALLVVDNYVLDAPTGAPAAANRLSIAALPFSNESAAQEDAEFLANGLHDEVLTQLSKIHALKVISRTSVEAYRGAARNIRQIGQELGVANILEGRVQRAGNMLRINVQLIDAETDEHLWAEIYDRELTAENIFAVQAEMAAAIAEALQATLTPEERQRINDVPTTDIRAYNFYLSGKEYRRSALSEESFGLAAQQLGRAVEEDPQFALAWAALAGAHMDLYWFGIDASAERRERARAAIDRAVAIAPDLPEAHLARAEYYYHGFRDYERALAELEIAARGISETSDFYLYRGAIERRVGRWEAAIADFERAVELDPRRSDLLVELGNTYASLREYAQAQSYYEQVHELAPDRDVFELAALARDRNGDWGPINELLRKRSPVLGRFRAVVGWDSAMIDRDYAAAHAYLDEMQEEGIEGSPAYFSRAAARGATYAAEGRAELAREQLELSRRQIETLIAAISEEAPEHSRYYVALAMTLAGLREGEAARAAAERAMRMMPPSLDAMLGRDMQRIAAMWVFAELGDAERTVALLDDFLSNPGASMSIEGLLPEPALDPVRDDPRFVALVDKHRRR